MTFSRTMALRFPRRLRCVAKSSLKAFNRECKTIWSSEAVAKGEQRTAVGLDQLRTRQGAEPYTVSIATAIRTKSNWTLGVLVAQLDLSDQPASRVNLAQHYRRVSLSTSRRPAGTRVAACPIWTAYRLRVEVGLEHRLWFLQCGLGSLALARKQSVAVFAKPLPVAGVRSQPVLFRSL